MTYAIDTGAGTQLCAGLPEQTVWTVAQRKADALGESVFVYEMSAPEGGAAAVEVAPAAPVADKFPTISIRTAAGRAETLARARECVAGDYLAEFDPAESADDPQSCCGYSEPLLAEVNRVLRRRGLALRADDVGLVVAALDEVAS